MPLPTSYLINIIGILFIGLIIWWFWLSRKKAKRIDSSVITIEVKDGVYFPARIEVPANRDVTLIFLRKDPSTCAEYVLFDTLNIYAKLPLNEKHQIVLRQLKPGKYAFTCQMKMYRGELIVTENK